MNQAVCPCVRVCVFNRALLFKSELTVEPSLSCQVSLGSLPAWTLHQLCEFLNETYGPHYRTLRRRVAHYSTLLFHLSLLELGGVPILHYLRPSSFSTNSRQFSQSETVNCLFGLDQTGYSSPFSQRIVANLAVTDFLNLSRPNAEKINKLLSWNFLFKRDHNTIPWWLKIMRPEHLRGMLYWFVFVIIVDWDLLSVKTNNDCIM